MEGQTIMNNYKIDSCIGRGTFGKVKLGIHLLTNSKVAIKLLQKSKIKDVSDVERVSREIHILKLIRHPNIIQLYEIIETQTTLYLIMEYASNGELFEHIVKNSRINEKEACLIFQQIMSGVEYLHKMGVSHRDLKPENLLFDEHHNIKIVDFGLSNTCKSDEFLSTACGSPCYAAPEMISGKPYNGFQVDIWSCGVILFAMLAGYLPFEDSNTNELYKKILNCEYEFPAFISSAGRDLIYKILTVDPGRRLTLIEIRNHPWFRQVFTQSSLGILVGFTPIPVDVEVIKALKSHGFDIDHCKKSIEANSHDHFTTTYYLTLKNFEEKRLQVRISQEKPRPPLMPSSPLAGNWKFRHRKLKEIVWKDLLNKRIDRNLEKTSQGYESVEKTLKNFENKGNGIKIENSCFFFKHSPIRNDSLLRKSVTPTRKIAKILPNQRFKSVGRDKSKLRSKRVSPKSKKFNKSIENYRKVFMLLSMMGNNQKESK